MPWRPAWRQLGPLWRVNPSDTSHPAGLAQLAMVLQVLPDGRSHGLAHPGAMVQILDCRCPNMADSGFFTVRSVVCAQREKPI